MEPIQAVEIGGGKLGETIIRLKAGKRRLWFPVCPLGTCKIFPIFRFDVYNKNQLSLIHEQLKVGIANQRHPLTSKDSSQHNPKKQE